MHATPCDQASTTNMMVPHMQIIRGEVEESSLPPLTEYLASAAERLSTMKQQPHGGLYGHMVPPSQL